MLRKGKELQGLHVCELCTNDSDDHVAAELGGCLASFSPHKKRVGCTHLHCLASWDSTPINRAPDSAPLSTPLLLLRNGIESLTEC